MLRPVIISYKLTTCQLLYLTNTYKHREYYLQYLFNMLYIVCPLYFSISIPYQTRICHLIYKQGLASKDPFRQAM